MRRQTYHERTHHKHGISKRVVVVRRLKYTGQLLSGQSLIDYEVCSSFLTLLYKVQVARHY